MAKKITPKSAKEITLEDAITALLNAKNAKYHKGADLYSEEIYNILVARTRTHFCKDNFTLRDVNTCNNRNVGLVRFKDCHRIVAANSRLLESIKQKNIHDAKDVIRCLIDKEVVPEEKKDILEYVDFNKGGLKDQRFEYKDAKGNVYNSVNPYKDFVKEAKALENLCVKHKLFVKEHPNAAQKALASSVKRGPGRPKGAKNKIKK